MTPFNMFYDTLCVPVHVPLGPLKGDGATQGRAFQPDGDQCWSANSSGGERGSVGR